jgi:predicted DNA-binding transcriptional regulator YafY
MPRNFSRHEQFLRIFALLDILSNAHQPIDDQALIAQLKERLGLSRLSIRTLHRDCDFLLTCGYPVDRVLLPGDRRSGWQLARGGDAGRKMPPEPLTLLELVAFTMGRDLLRPFEGTILWTGIESLRHKLERDLPPEMLTRLKEARRVFQVEGIDPSRYAGRPRLISTLSAAITDCREIDVEEQAETGAVSRLRLQPHRLVIRPPTVELLGYPAGAVEGAKPVLLDIARIQKVTPLDVTFVPRPIEPEPE